MERKHNKKIVPTAKMLRKNMTKQECRLWYDFLRSYPVKFTRQKVLGRYIADFYCASAKLVIEFDGDQHARPENIKLEAQRTEYLENFGLKVIRIANYDIDKHFDDICDYIHRLVVQRIGEIGDNPSVTS